MRILQRWVNLPKWRYYGLCILFGALGQLGHAPYYIWPVTILMFALLIYAWTQQRPDLGPRRGFGTGFFFGLGYFLAGTFWIGAAFIARGPEFIPAMVPMTLGLAALLALFWAFAGSIFIRFTKSGLAPFIGAAMILFLAEYARGHLMGGLPWALPGYVYEGGAEMSQSARLFGIYGLSFLLLLVSALFAKTIACFSSPLSMQNIRSFWPLSLALLLLGSNFIYGYSQLSRAENSFYPDIRLRIVQVPFAQKDQMDKKKSVSIVNDFLRETQSPGLENITHVIWPEGASTGFTLDNEPLIKAMGQILISVDDTPPVWLLNSLRYETLINNENQLEEHVYNTSAAMVFSTRGNGTLAAYNDKTKLVPFGEYFPGGRIVENFGGKLLSTNLASITPAQQKLTAKFPGLPLLSPQICYEIIFSGLTPMKDQQGAPAFILNQSNDAWFGRSSGPWQHANIATYRAIETGLPIIRSASNGVSGVIDPYGRYLKKTRLQDKVAMDTNLPLPRENRMKLKHLYIVLVLINIFGAFICSMREKRISKV